MKHNISNITAKNCIHLTKICLLTSLSLAITIAIKPVYATDSQVQELSNVKSLAPVRTSRDLTNEPENVKAQLDLGNVNFSQSVAPPELLARPQVIAKAKAKPDSSRIMTASELLTAEVGMPVIMPLQPQQMAQTDSSGSVGDTFGEVNKLRQDLLIEPIVEYTAKTRIVPAPSSAAGTPTAYGASWRQAFIGTGLYFPYNGNTDGSLTVGFGLGDAYKSLGLETSINVISVGGQKPNFGDFADSGTVGLKLHKYFKDGTAVALGWSNAIKWGEADIPQETIYSVITKPMDKLTVSLGLGTGSYRSKGAINSGDNDLNLFGSVGYRFIPQASVMSSWTGRAWNLGASVVPIKDTPLVFNLIFTDVTDNAKEAGIALTLGYSINF